jgi:hypothetical protein
MSDTVKMNGNTAPAGTDTGTAPAAEPEPLRAGHTPNLPALLGERGISLLVTTYQAGKLVAVREQGGALNTHYRSFQAPMGLALTPSADCLAIGTTLQVWEFRDVPEVAARLEPKGTHDA